MGHILWVEPVFKEMIWGGNQLKEKYGYATPAVRPSRSSRTKDSSSQISCAHDG